MSININLIDMENLKGILMTIKDEYLLKTGHNLNMKAIDECFDALKDRPREPRAVNRNEQTQELCKCEYKSYYLVGNVKVCVKCKGVII